MNWRRFLQQGTVIASSILCRLQLLNQNICRDSFLISHVFLNLIRHLYLDVEKGVINKWLNDSVDDKHFSHAVLKLFVDHQASSGNGHMIQE